MYRRFTIQRWILAPLLIRGLSPALPQKNAKVSKKQISASINASLSKAVQQDVALKLKIIAPASTQNYNQRVKFLAGAVMASAFIELSRCAYLTPIIITIILSKPCFVISN